MGFVQYFLDEPKKDHCDKLPYTSVTFGNPFTPTEEGSLGNPSENKGEFCTGEQGFKFMRGVQVEAGFNLKKRGVVS